MNEIFNNFAWFFLHLSMKRTEHFIFVELVLQIKHHTSVKISHVYVGMYVEEIFKYRYKTSMNN